MNKNIFEDFEYAFNNQIKLFINSKIDIRNYSRILKMAIEKYLYCLSNKSIKHIPINILNSGDEYTSFLVFLSREAYLNNCIELAEVSYLLNRRINNFECFYTREIPEIFHLDHPIGSVIGQAKLSNFLVIYQGVTIGGDLKLRYPKIKEGVVLFAKASVIGNCNVGSNCAIGANSQLFQKDLQDNHSISLRDDSFQYIKKMNWNVKEKFFKSCKLH